MDGHISYHPLLSRNAAGAGNRRMPELQITRLMEQQLLLIPKSAKVLATDKTRQS